MITRNPEKQAPRNSNEMRVEIGVRLSLSRERAGLSRLQLAQKLGSDRHVICKWEKGVKFPSIPRLVDLAGALRTSSDYLLGIADE